jgi:hypothetical protein
MRLLVDTASDGVLLTLTYTETLSSLQSDCLILLKRGIEIMGKKLIIVIFSLISIKMLYASLPGETEGILLTFPSGVRQDAMGETGTALADDESCLFFNPAGLAKDNSRLESGAASFTFEKLLPSRSVDNITHCNAFAAFKPVKESVGGFGFTVNILHMPQNDSISGPNFEGVWGISHSFNLKRWNLTRHFFGYSLKYMQNRYDAHKHVSYVKYIDEVITVDTLYQPVPESIGRSFAIDIGYLFEISSHFHFGAALLNMGPAVHFSNSAIKKPIPFELNTAFAYTDSISLCSSRTLFINSELRLEREVAKTHKDKDPDPFYKALTTDFSDTTFKANAEEVNVHLGVEIKLDDLASVRLGYLHDEVGKRREFHWGVGTNAFKHTGLDFYMIVSPETKKNAGKRKNQCGITLSFYQIGNWFKK